MPREQRSATGVDFHVGRRLRQRRVLLGLSQEGLAAMLEVSYQQIQKYETARNRVSASRLYQLAQMLEVPITWFYDGLELDPAETGRASNLSQTVDREVLQFVGMYCRIRNAGARSRLRELTSVLAGRK